jgi:cardiolipin synthase A/B
MIKYWDEIVLIVGHMLSVTGLLFALVLFSRVQADKRAPGATIAWLMGMVFIPYLAIPLYLLIGDRKIRQVREEKAVLHLESHEEASDEAIRKLSDPARRFLQVEGVTPATEGNRVETIPGPVEAYERLIAMFDEAEHCIHITTFALASDEVAKAVVSKLAEKARQGVDVRLLVDAVGSFFTKKRFTEELRQAGGKIGVFHPVMPLRKKWAANLRNHRKICVVDGTMAMIGGRNIGKEYMGPELKEDMWSDFSLMVYGPAVEEFHQIFAADWEFATDEPEAESLAFSQMSIHPPMGDTLLQIIASGPDSPNDPFVEVFLSLLFQTKERLWMVTPYFVPDEIVLHALKVLARLGVDVRLVIPRHSNRHIADLARRYYLRELHRAGVKVYLHEGAFLHTKLLLMDDEICSVGSVNLDMRSFYLNFELAAFLFSKEDAAKISKHIEQLIKESTPYTRRSGRRRDVLTESLENLSLLLSPLL